MQIADKRERITGRMHKLADKKQKVTDKNLDKKPDKKPEFAASKEKIAGKKKTIDYAE